MGGKHGASRFRNYRAITDVILRSFIDAGFVLSENMGYEAIGDGLIAHRGEIQCQGGIVLEVEKVLTILDGTGDNALVQTTYRSYHAYARGKGNIVRYCSGHDHRPYDHVHRYDAPATWNEILPVQELWTEDEIPTLSDVLDELRDFYYTHEL